MGKIRNGESAIEGASDMTAFCMVRWSFPRALLPISMIDIQRRGPLSVLSSGLNSRWHVLRHATLTTTEIYVRGEATQQARSHRGHRSAASQEGSFRPPDKLIAMLRGRS